jgi:hypothetical protein
MIDASLHVTRLRRDEGTPRRRCTCADAEFKHPLDVDPDSRGGDSVLELVVGRNLATNHV